MFEQETADIAAEVNATLVNLEIPYPDDLDWTHLPFSGSWGISTSFFKTASWEAKSGERSGAIQVSVPQRAQEIAEAVSQGIKLPAGFERVEAVRGYLNIYFSTSEFSKQVLSQILEEQDHYGCLDSKDKIVMVEFSQPNTHKAFHVGHLRNVILGESIARILECAGYRVLRANYLGDMAST